MHVSNLSAGRHCAAGNLLVRPAVLLAFFFLLALFAPFARAAVPSVPTGLNAPTGNIATTSFVLNWNASTGGPTSYDVFKSGSLFGNSISTSLNITGLTAGTSYSMTVKAKNSSGSSAASSTLAVPTLPNAPTGLAAASITDTSFTLSWTAVTGATSYDVFNASTLLGNTTAKSLALTGLPGNTAYAITVVAKNTSGPSAASTLLNVTTAPSAPTGLNVPPASITSTAFTLAWSPSTGATSYDVFKGATLFGNATSASLNITGLAANTTYSMTVKSKSSAGSSAASSALQATTLMAVPGAPKSLSTSNVTSTSVTLTWTAPTTGGAPTGYDVYNGTSIVGSTAGLAVSLSNLTPATAYSLTVEAKNISGSSAASNTAKFTTLPLLPGAPTGLTASAVTATSAKLTWTAPTTGGAPTGYDIYSGATVIGSTTTALTFNLTGLSGVTAYSFTVKAKNASGSSAPSNQANFTTLLAVPGAPTGLSASNITSTSAVLTWTAPTTGGTPTEYDVYSGSTLLGSTTGALTLTLSTLSPSKAYTLTVKAKNASGFSAASTAVNFTTLPPVPGAPTGLTASAITASSVTLSWTAPTTGGAPTGYDIYNGSTIMGSTTAALTLSLSNLSPSSSYVFSVKAKNASGSSASSNSVSVTTAINHPPSVTLTAPVANTIYTWPASVSLTAVASDSDGTIAKVEFFNGSKSLGLATSSPYTITWSPTTPTAAALTATATDNLGATATSSPVNVTFLGSVPLQIDFENPEGYAAGDINGQNGWIVSAGAAQITKTDAAHGTQSAILLANSAPTELDQEFGSMTSNPTVVYVDFWTKPVAGINYTSGTLLDIDSARIAFVLSGSQGQFALLDGNGNGGGPYRNVGSLLSLDASNAATNWQRVTVRLDYVAKTWDFYLNGKLIFADETFRVNSATYFSWFSLKGNVSANVKLDNILVSSVNPLFTDANNDGIDDAWEAAHGLSTTTNVRSGDPDGDGLTNMQEYLYGTDPLNADTDGDGVRDGVEVSLGLNPLVPDGASFVDKLPSLRLWLAADSLSGSDGSLVSQWPDISGKNNPAIQNTVGFQPTLVNNQVNGRPIVRFNGATGQYFALPDLMHIENGSTAPALAGEVFIVMKSSAPATQRNGLWGFGTTPGALYPEQISGIIYDDFGSNSQQIIGLTTVNLAQFQLLNITSQAGSWIERFNGSATYLNSVNTVAWNAAPTLGKSGYGQFSGDIAEVLIFDTPLTDAQRESINVYLNNKYALFTTPLAAPTNVIATAISDTEISLIWAPGVSRPDRFVYEIWRQTGSGIFAYVRDVSGNGFVDSSLSSQTSYNYYVRVRALNGTGPDSSIASAVTFATPTSSSLSGTIPLPSLRLWMSADSISGPDGSAVGTWSDISGLNITSAGHNLPILVANGINGRPVVRFDGNKNQYFSLPDLMHVKNGAASPASAGEIFIVMKSSAPATQRNGLWGFGTTPGALYPEQISGIIYDDFGSNSQQIIGLPTVNLAQVQLLNITSQVGSWVERFNGSATYINSVNTVAWNAAPTLGKSGYGQFSGDIAEVLVFDTPLSDLQRESVNRYLNKKYQLYTTVPVAPTGVTASPVSDAQISLSWTEGPPRPDRIVYEIWRQTGNGPFVYIQDDSANTFIDSGLSAQTTYTYYIRERTLNGASPNSSSVSETTLVAPSAGGSKTIPLASLRLWLAADSLAGQDGSALGAWPDLSGFSNNASGINGPTLVYNQLNGRPIVRFNGAYGQYFALPDLMHIENGSTAPALAGEVFIVMKSSAPATQRNGLWGFGTTFGALYPEQISGIIYDDFGSNSPQIIGLPTVNLAQFQLLNITSQAGSWIERFNGAATYLNPVNTVAWNAAPTLGKSGYGQFSGDIAEVMIFDSPLTNAQRESVELYLNNKYALYTSAVAPPTALAGKAISDSQVSLSWTAEARPDSAVYEVWRQTGSGAYVYVQDATGGTFVDANLTPLTVYSYEVRGRFLNGTSVFSAPISVATLAAPASGGSAISIPLTSLRLWLSADAISGVDRSPVGVWSDLSGSGNTARGTNDPVLVNNQINGRPIVRFDGTKNQFFTLPDLMHVKNGTPTTAGAGDVFIIMKSSAPTSQRNSLWGFGTTGGGALYPEQISGIMYDDFGSSTLQVLGLPSVDLSQFQLLNVTSQSSSWIERFNGSQTYINSINSVFWNATPTIGMSGFGSFSGDIAEVLIFDTPLTDAQRESVNVYLNNKYALGLPLSALGQYRDSNFDGLTDVQDLSVGFDPFSIDVDGDGVSNQVELANGTSPFLADSDFDGVPDGTDAFPLDPTRSTLPAALPGDTSAPVVTLNAPFSATLF